MNREPTIGVGMPVYNGERYLSSAIESVLGQTFGDFELVIVDNASEDATREICEQYTRCDKRVIYHRNAENIGAARNYERAFRYTRGEFFRWHNADDLIAPGYHEACLEQLISQPDAVLAAGTTMLIDSEGRELENYNDNLSLMQSTPAERFEAFFDQVGLTNVIYGLMRRSAVAKTPIFGKGDLPAADTRFMALLCLHGKFVQMQEVFFFRRMHQQAFSAERDNTDAEVSFWSGGKSDFRWPNWKRQFSYWKAVARLDCSRPEKWDLVRYLSKYFLAHKADLLRDLVPLSAQDV